jgi:transcriptional regulator with XRE-family HTH domain
MINLNDHDVGLRIQALRKRCGLSIRQLADHAGVTAGMISCIERGKTSPSIATFQKLLAALNSDLASFFSTAEDTQVGPVFLRERMRAVSDPDHHYTLVFPHLPDIHVEMLDEQVYPSANRPDYETLQCDVAGYVLAGEFVIDIDGRPPQELRPGDGFYIVKGQPHRGYPKGDAAVRLITVYWPGKY